MEACIETVVLEDSCAEDLTTEDLACAVEESGVAFAESSDLKEGVVNEWVELSTGIIFADCLEFKDGVV